jgi:hypothetical protein
LSRNAQLVGCSIANTYVTFYSLCFGHKTASSQASGGAAKDFCTFWGATPFDGFASNLLNLEILSSALAMRSPSPNAPHGHFSPIVLETDVDQNGCAVAYSKLWFVFVSATR